MLRWALTTIVLSLGLLGCTEHRLAPGQVYDLELCESERVEITNNGPGSVRIRASLADEGLSKHPTAAERTLEGGETRVYRCGWRMRSGPPAMFIKVQNISGAEAVIVVGREPLDPREWAELTASDPDGTQAGRRAAEGVDPPQTPR